MTIDRHIQGYHQKQRCKFLPIGPQREPVTAGVTTKGSGSIYRNYIGESRQFGGIGYGHAVIASGTDAQVLRNRII